MKNNSILNFSMADLNKGRRFYSSTIEEDEKPRKKIINNLTQRQFNEYENENKNENEV